MYGRYVLLIVATLSGPVVEAAAQDRVYVTGGWTTTWREPGWAPSFAAPAAPPAAVVPGAIVGGGVWLQRHVAIEGVADFHRAQPVRWHFGYLFAPNSDQLTNDRDAAVVGYVRIAPMRGRRVSVEPTVGGGISWHRAASVITADCGPGSRPTPCLPVTPPAPSDTYTTAEPVVALGLDVAVRVSARVALTPGFRLLTVRRRTYLTGYAHRGPASGRGVLSGFAVSLRYAIK